MASIRPIDSFLENVMAQMSELTHGHRLAFCASCCERALPNYATFVSRESWGMIEPFRTALDAAWSMATGERPGVDLGQLKNACQSWVPNSDDFPSAQAAAAQDAVLMVLILLEHVTNADPHYCQRVATLSRDTVDMWVQLTKKLDSAVSNLEEQIEQSRLMQRETGKLREDLADLQREVVLTTEFNNRFRDASMVSGKSNIGLPGS
jgi:uncharacterized protein YjaG (DUF416 family)